jgi:hypothetical protein
MSVPILKRILGPILPLVDALALRLGYRSLRNDTYLAAFAQQLMRGEKSVLPIVQEERAFAIARALQFCASNKIVGAIYEFGVQEGASAELISRLANAIGYKAGLYLFDSFKGLPEVQGRDRYTDVWFEGKYAGGSAEADLVCSRLTKFRSRDSFEIIHGFYKDVLPRCDIRERAALIHIDCDLYSSARCALEFATKVVQDGTVLLFDDYYCFAGNPAFGERRAVAEWALRNTEISITQWFSYGWHGQAMICHKTVPQEADDE